MVNKNNKKKNFEKKCIIKLIHARKTPLQKQEKRQGVVRVHSGMWLFQREVKSGNLPVKHVHIF